MAVLRQVAHDGTAAALDGTHRGAEQPGNEAEQRGLAPAVRAGQHDAVLGTDGGLDVAEHVALAVAETDVVDVEQGVIHCAGPGR